MKLVVFSDNHKDIVSVDKILASNLDADLFLSLGDSEMSEPALSSRNVFGVKGNYPFEPDFPDELVFEYEGHKTLITHGHRYFVKTGMYHLTRRAEETGCDLALFGHTHQFFVSERDGIVLVNPGSTAYPKMGFKMTYAVLIIEPRRIKAEIIDIDSGMTIETFVKKY